LAPSSGSFQDQKRVKPAPNKENQGVKAEKQKKNERFSAEMNTRSRKTP
jgi:hypothetical protein